MELNYHELREAHLPQIETIVDGHYSRQFSWDKKKLRDEMKVARFFGATDREGQLLAFVAVAERGGALEATVLASRRENQGKGIMAGLLTWLIASQKQEAEVWLEVHEANLNARNLYRKLGFKEVGKRPGYYSDQSAAILCTRIC
jgi:[ribosomal protein S18]-alanine N-acetyltransferase